MPHESMWKMTGVGKTLAGVQIRPRQEHCRRLVSRENTTLMVQNDFADFNCSGGAVTTAARWKIWSAVLPPQRKLRGAGPGFTRPPLPSPEEAPPLLTWASIIDQLTGPLALGLDPQNIRRPHRTWPASGVARSPHQHSLEDDQEDIYREGARGHGSCSRSYQTQN